MRMFFSVCCTALVLAATAAAAQAQTPAPIRHAVADPGRPAEDVARDANRKPAETLAFAGVKPGDVVADYIANTGYFTRLFSAVAGPKGHVYAVELHEVVKYPNVAKGYAGLKAWAPAHPNTTVETVAAAAAVAFARKLDVFWISQNYHDLHDKFLGPVDNAAFILQRFRFFISLDNAGQRDREDRADRLEGLGIILRERRLAVTEHQHSGQYFAEIRARDAHDRLAFEERALAGREFLPRFVGA